MKAMIYVQHLVGSGPAMRAAALAAELAGSGVETALVTGNRLPAFVRYGDYDIIDLPVARPKSAAGSIIVDDRGSPVEDAWRKRRRGRLLAAFEEFDPDVVVTECWPLGRRFPDFELDALVAAARERPKRCALVCAANDVVVCEGGEPGARAAVERLAHFDLLLVNGDPDLVPLEPELAGSSEIAAITRPTGYLRTGSDASEPPPGEGENEIIVSCGSGAAGDLLLTRAVQARAAGIAADHTWRILVGNDMDDLLLSRLAADAPAGVVVERARSDFPNLLSRARLSVSQAGYNTFTDVLAAGCPAVFVPFARGGEMAQTRRAEAAAARGGAVVLPELDLSEANLGAAIETALELERGAVDVDLDGLVQSVRLIRGAAAAAARADATD